MFGIKQSFGIELLAPSKLLVSQKLKAGKIRISESLEHTMRTLATWGVLAGVTKNWRA